MPNLTFLETIPLYKLLRLEFSQRKSFATNVLEEDLFRLAVPIQSLAPDKSGSFGEFWLCLSQFALNPCLTQPFRFLDFGLYMNPKSQILNYQTVSIASNSNLISFHSSQATANSGDHLAASRIISLPSRAKLRPSLRA